MLTNKTKVTVVSYYCNYRKTSNKCRFLNKGQILAATQICQSTSQCMAGVCHSYRNI